MVTGKGCVKYNGDKTIASVLSGKKDHKEIGQANT
jgi:hypothetical protein